MPIALRVITFIVLFLLVAPVRAGADWLLIPYAGVRFGGSTALSDLDNAAGERSYTLGLSVAGVGAGVLGIEADVGHTPGFFQRGDHPAPLITRSSVTSVGGNLILTLPLSVTRESLRPYAVVGAGLLRATSARPLRDDVIRSTMPAVTFGLGAVGFFSDDTGVRFDMRLHRSLGQGDDELVRPGHRLRFWRGTIGVIRRF
jgi:hypothetical protein